MRFFAPVFLISAIAHVCCFQPGFGRQIIRLVHESKNNRLVIFVSFGDPAPQVTESTCRQVFCSDHRAMISCIIMHIEDHPHLLGSGITDNSVE